MFLEFISDTVQAMGYSQQIFVRLQMKLGYW